LAALIGLAGCGTVQAGHHATAQRGKSDPVGIFPQARPQAIEPAVGAQPATITPNDPVGDPSAHAPPISQVRHELHLEAVSVTPNGVGYINPLYYVTCCGRWERTDQGVDANMPVGAPILAPSRVKILDVEPNWYAGQPLIYFELLDGKDAGMVQYVAEEITDLQRPGTYVPKGGVIARYASSGTGIESGLSTLNGITMAMATTGYEEGQVTPAGAWIRKWLNSLGAKAGSPSCCGSS
jgi:hypothetical protein